jgi:hypothetical protein
MVNRERAYGVANVPVCRGPQGHTLTSGTLSPGEASHQRNALTILRATLPRLTFKSHLRPSNPFSNISMHISGKYSPCIPFPSYVPNCFHHSTPPWRGHLTTQSNQLAELSPTQPLTSRRALTILYFHALKTQYGILYVAFAAPKHNMGIHIMFYPTNVSTNFLKIKTRFLA